MTSLYAPKVPSLPRTYKIAFLLCLYKMLELISCFGINLRAQNLFGSLPILKINPSWMFELMDQIRQTVASSGFNLPLWAKTVTKSICWKWISDDISLIAIHKVHIRKRTNFNGHPQTLRRLCLLHWGLTSRCWSNGYLRAFLGLIAPSTLFFWSNPMHCNDPLRTNAWHQRFSHCRSLTSHSSKSYVHRSAFHG